MEIVAEQQSHQSVIAHPGVPELCRYGGHVVRASTAIGAPWAHDVDPAFAYNIAATNASTAEPARGLVVLVTGSAGSPKAEGE
jgi:hypothetical protein